MQYQVKILPIAYVDLRKAKMWYAEENGKLAEEFKIEVNKEIKYIGRYSEIYQLKYHNLRQSILNRFPYSIFYIVEEELKQVIVFGILHSSRNPEIVRKRIL